MEQNPLTIEMITLLTDVLIDGEEFVMVLRTLQRSLPEVFDTMSPKAGLSSISLETIIFHDQFWTDVMKILLFNGFIFRKIEDYVFTIIDKNGNILEEMLRNEIPNANTTSLIIHKIWNYVIRYWDSRLKNPIRERVELHYAIYLK